MASSTSHSPSEPSRSNVVLSALVVIACFLVFGLIVYLAYLPNRTETVTADGIKLDDPENWKFSDKGRYQHLETVRDTERKIAGSYAVLDPKAGIYRLPIDRAIELYVQEHSAPAAKH